MASLITIRDNTGQFSGNREIEAILIGKEIREIKKNSFKNCKSLKTVIFEEGLELEEIGGSAFKGCTSLEHVQFRSNSTIRTIMEDAFSGCRSLKTINIPEGLISLRIGSFRNCSSLEEITIPTSTIFLVNGIFNGCSSLRKITYLGPMHILHIYDESCKSLKEIFVSNDVYKGNIDRHGVRLIY
jgi:hypothetical protein